MLFNKQVENEDLKSERGAVQTEIGSYKVIEKPLYYLGKLFQKITPPQDGFYKSEFSIQNVKDLPPRYKQKINNQKFSMNEVLKHYNDYYYPANMTVKIVGNFDMGKMKSTIRKHFGEVLATGNMSAKEPNKSPVLNNIPYKNFEEGGSENYGYIGAKYILDDYKKYLVIESYIDNLALRLQQNLRNELGHTYSINSSSFGDGKAQVATVVFDGLHNQFDENISTVKEVLNNDLIQITDQTISEALIQYRKNYTSIEQDTKSLMHLIDTSQYLKVKHNSTESAYSIFDSISPEFFRDTIKNTFKKENMYSNLYREYYFFPYDVLILSFITVIGFLILYFKLPQLDRLRLNNNYNYRNIILSRRLSNRFLGFIYFVLIFIASVYLWEWIKYFLLTNLTGNSNYLSTIELPYSYFWGTLDDLLGICLFLFLCRYLFTYHAHLAVTENKLCLVGHRIKAISKSDILEIDTSKNNINKIIKSRGLSLMFWKPLVKITLEGGKTLYLRSRNAKHLKEDLNKWLKQSNPAI